jgi:hypothetical protein
VGTACKRVEWPYWNNAVADRNVLGGGVPRIADRTVSIGVTERIAVCSDCGAPVRSSWRNYAVYMNV